jgi:predicted SAM-dependent methyltransferase/ADP-heptose:LPS heptosyltransferase
MTWSKEGKQGNEAAKISWEIVRWTRGRGLDIGAGLYRTFPHFITVDNNIDAQIFGHQMPRPDVFVSDAGDLSLFANESMDFIFSSHMLEHVEEDRLVKVLKEWWRVLKNDAYLVLYLPDEDQYPKVGEEGANPDHKWNVSYNAVVKLMEHVGAWNLRDFQKRSEADEYSLYFVFQKLDAAKLKKKGQQHLLGYADPKPIKTVGVCRYGAYGDLLQTASICWHLKQQGYHVTLYCTPDGQQVVQHDPNIDDFYIQDRDQVPNQGLEFFWREQAKKYDRWINLSESVEGALLTIRNRIVDSYPPSVRHALCNRNYLEYMHEIAQVPFEPKVHFYPTELERAWAKKERAKHGDFCVVYSLSGSSVHKHWPWMDNVISAMLLDFPEIEVVLVGGPDGVILEQGWEKTPRVTCRSGKWSIRETLAFVQTADVVIGSETGVLNSVSFEEMPKVVFLSHSTQENLTRDWVNTHSLASLETHCKGRGKNEAPACHQMHYGWSHCTEAPAPAGTEELYPRKGAGVAQCQADIDPENAYKVMWHVIQWQLEKYAQERGLPPPGVVHLTEEQARAMRAHMPRHLQDPSEVIAQQPTGKSVIEA